MTDHRLAEATAAELQELYATRAVSPREAVEATLARARSLDPSLHAFVTIAEEAALEQADAAERALRDPNRSRQPALLGVPVSIKDLIATKGLRTTRGSLVHRDWIPDFDAVVVERLRRAGAIVFGKTNTCEDGWKGDAGNRLIGPTRNPWRLELSAGGSSGGAGAAIAAGIGPLATGTDGAGSIRIPSAFCGIVGYKPSLGLVPYVPMSPENLSHLGPMARTVTDAALMLDAVAGPDPRDMLSLEAADGQYANKITEPPRPLRIAWTPTLGFARTEEEVERIVTEALTGFEASGHHIEPIDPVLEDPYPIIDVLLAGADAGAYRDSLAGLRDLLDPGHVEVIERGLRYSAADLAKAQAERAVFYEAMRKMMEPFDLLATPTVPISPFTAGLDHPPAVAGELRAGLEWTPFTYPFNLTGQPALSLPAGMTASGLPVGLQIVGHWHADGLVLQAGRAFERARPWATSYRPLWDELLQMTGAGSRA